MSYYFRFGSQFLMAKKQNQHKKAMKGRKHKKKTEKLSNKSLDIITVLPSSVLHHILSFLPVDDVVRTSLLSRQWRNIWCSAHVYNFEHCSLSSQELDFFAFVDSVLLLRDGSNMLKFRLWVECPKDEAVVGHINDWIIYAVRHKVQVLEFGVRPCAPYINCHTTAFTTQIFSCKSLRELKLSTVTLNLPPLNLISLPALKILHLRDVDINDGQFTKMLCSAVPSLESLILESCDYQTDMLFLVFSHQLKNLIVTGVFPKSMEITAPNLISLQLNQRNRKSLQSVTFKSSFIHLMHTNISLQASWIEPMVMFFRRLQNTHSLTLSSLSILSFAAKLQKEDVECIKTIFHNLKCLKIGTAFSDGEIMVINSILNHSPHVENIFLEIETGVMGGEEYTEATTGELVEAVKVCFTCDLAHLKNATIQGFLGSENEVKFIEFVLENATVLEKLIVFKSGNGNGKDLVKIGKKLLNHPRAASSNVGFLFG